MLIAPRLSCGRSSSFPTSPTIDAHAKRMQADSSRAETLALLAAMAPVTILWPHAGMLVYVVGQFLSQNPVPLQRNE